MTANKTSEESSTIEELVSEVMDLVVEVACAGMDYGAQAGKLYKVHDAEDAVESKLREILGKKYVPLTDEQIKRIDDQTHFHESFDWNIRFARAIERWHGIGVEK